MPSRNERSLRALLIVAIAAVAAGGSADLLMDRPARWLSFHVIFETTMVAGALVLVTALWLGWWRAERSAAELRLAAQASLVESEQWRNRARAALEGLGEAIEEQFALWELTPAEREVGLLLLKGYSHKRVASATGRSERTARQHAASLYQKAGLGGRAELSAFFLRDLMLPARATSPVTAVLEGDGTARPAISGCRDFIGLPILSAPGDAGAGVRTVPAPEREA